MHRPLSQWATVFLLLATLVTHGGCRSSPGPALDAHESQRCATAEVYEQYLATIPGFRERRVEIERLTDEYIRSNAASGLRSGIVIIPVVVHVVHNTAAENVSDAQIQSQIAVLNADFRRLNADAGSVPGVFQPVSADARIQFQLAVRDPNCQPTTGITRTATGVTAFPANDSMKSAGTGGANPWPSDQYLNLWVCDLASGLLGYATFPGGPAALDGVVIDYQAFGTIGSAQAPFNRGRTATHEVGHWLNLFHIWGDDQSMPNTCSGTDLVADTPNQSVMNFGCPTFPRVSCSNGPNGDMFMNYMDYTDDACMFTFTTGQSLRMDATLYGVRASIVASDALIPPTPGSVGGADLFSQDTAHDVGNEPNTASPYFWTSDDIWVRNQDDGITNQEHQNPEYRIGGSPPSYIYVRVRNRGCTGSQSGDVRLYWAKASTALSWPKPWDGSVTGPPLMGKELTPLQPVAVNAGDAAIVKFPWSPPNPADYAAFGADKGHFCLLSRIETAGGMTFPETASLGDNVKNNNNIVWKNIEVVDNLPGSAKTTSVLVGDFGGSRIRARVTFDPPTDLTVGSVFDAGRVVVDLGPRLYDSWQRAGGGGTGVTPIGGTSLSVTAGGFIDALPFGPGELAGVQVTIEPYRNVRRPGVYALDMRQFNLDSGGTTSFVGAQRIVLKVTARDITNVNP